ncbi:2,3,4,5-tetrahydropyridine-2,6-dicarboxylate N-succinyltransferase [Neiella sp. HB171785]|uniref:2,3,4,5-tetrahydropyridine-2,6-dicarboxylate N-succinyltransferase n=1 Tax=Neiella litorisoli TaxID=2771431 RepID=A0A8J6UPS5_9GAMM|nr:2,3,4,5-tetrahydropyridine-2,6-dicarboxylate N-succinyltransferase [Neiella litorisoli]MBD1389357.1 2,3,4,5-tetrahydropyridine-2,6-dicarboxylate N-succinyltransferase [Neiella litorisoli]
MTNLQVIIEAAFERRSELSPTSVDQKIRDAIEQTLTMLTTGQLRVAEKLAGEWVVHQWLKKAILLSLQLADDSDLAQQSADVNDWPPFQSPQQLAAPNQRFACRSAHIAEQVALMPCYISHGAYVDQATQIGAWAAIGSCAQIGKQVQLCDGVSIGSMLEPLSAKPTIIEDDCYIGASSVIADGVVIEQGSIIATGVTIGQSTRIYHRDSGATYHGRVPAGSVVVAGSLPYQDGKYSLNAAIIVRSVDANTRATLGVDALLRAAL